MNILIIEDQPTELKLANHVLSIEGHVVAGLEAADQAYEAILRDRPELILLDMSLPGLDSLALVKLIREDPRTIDIVVVAVTSCPEAYPRALALNSECDAYILKPLSTRTLSRELDDVVKRRSEVAENE